MALNLERQQRLLNLAMEAAVRAIEEKASAELHSQRACAFTDSVAENVVPGGLQNARKIESPVLVEMLIFCGEDCALQDFRNLVVGDQNATLQCERADGLPVIRIKLR